MKKGKTITHDELRPEYDLKNLQVRKFGTARKQFGNFVKLEPDVAATFLDAASVNEALRFLIRGKKRTARNYIKYKHCKVLVHTCRNKVKEAK